MTIDIAAEFPALVTKIRSLRAQADRVDPIFDSSPTGAQKDRINRAITHDFFGCQQRAWLLFSIHYFLRVKATKKVSLADFLLTPIETLSPARRAQSFKEIMKSCLSGSGPEHLARAFLKALPTHEVINELAFSAFPSMFQLFLDGELNKGACLFLMVLMKEAPSLEAFSHLLPFFSAFFHGCYFFHDQIWDVFLYRYYTVGVEDVCESLLFAIREASMHLGERRAQLQLIAQHYSVELAVSFFVQDVLLNSLFLREPLFPPRLFLQLRKFLDTLVDAERLFAAVWSSPGANAADLPLLSAIFLPTAPFHIWRGSSWALCLELFRGVPQIVSDQRWASIGSGSVDTQKDPLVRIDCSFHVKLFAEDPPTNPLFDKDLRALQKRGDVLDLLSDCPRDFAQFALSAEVWRAKENLATRQEIPEKYLMLACVERLRKLLDSCIAPVFQNAVRELVQIPRPIPDGKLAETAHSALGQLAKIRPRPGVARPKASETSGQDSTIDFFDCFELPVIRLVMNSANPDAPVLAAIDDEFGRYHWDFAASAGVVELSELIGDELTWFRGLLLSIPECPIGDRFLRFLQLSELFKQTVGILNEAGVRAEPDMILAAIMPTLEASRILSAFGRTFGVATRLRDGNVPCRRLSEIDSMFSWMTKILTVNSDFLSSFIQILSKA